jgi:sugar lactone lactonase YvrE
MKKTLAVLGALSLAVSAQADHHLKGEHKLTKLWETDAVLKTPESVRFDAKRKVLYVSNIDGEPWAADGKGSVAKVGLDGKVIAAEWVTGLNAPKGMAMDASGKTLYVVDTIGVVAIDVDAAKITSRTPIPEGKQLNDIASDGKGTLYVSDSSGKTVYEVKDGKVSVLLDSTKLKGPNGLLVYQGALHVLDDNALWRVGADKSLTKIGDGGLEGGADGLESVAKDEFLVSCWKGAIHYIDAKGVRTLLFDGAAQKISTADIGWDPATRTVYAPTFFKNSVIAFKVD